MKIDSLNDFVSFVRNDEKIILTSFEKIGVQGSRHVLEEAMANGGVYGANRGIGALLNEIIKKEDLDEFQRNLISRHAAGTGGPINKKIVKGAMLLLINTLKKGNSGISLGTLEAIVGVYNSGCPVPNIPKIGSLGASGDLAALSHLAAFFVEKHGIKMRPGEVIFLINGTHFCTSTLAFTVHEAEKLCQIADLVAAMTIYALGANIGPFQFRMSHCKSHSGAKISEKNLRKILALEKTENSSDQYPQSAYSLRCVPQVHGAIHDAIAYAKKTAEDEIDSISLNPVVFSTLGKVRCGGNFHAQPMAAAADALGVALTTLAGISERRINRLLDPKLSELPAFLSPNPNIDPGLMMSQYDAAANISRNKVLATPGSINSIPVSADQEDFVSMADTSISKAGEILEGTQYVLASELLCAVCALDFHENKNTIPETIKKVAKLIRKRIRPADKQNKIWPIFRDTRAVFKLVKSGKINELIN